MAPNAAFGLPAASAQANRALYYYKGITLTIEGEQVGVNHSIELAADQTIILKNGPAESHLLLLQGRPISEPVVQYGPFVMNSKEEVQKAMSDFQRTHFGGWPWPSHDHVHPREKGRFAIHADGREEIKD
jgi:redox-sensitive bicupin YhaK (pirin superfamily)